jgi:hypothetical protein
LLVVVQEVETVEAAVAPVELLVVLQMLYLVKLIHLHLVLVQQQQEHLLLEV